MSPMPTYSIRLYHNTIILMYGFNSAPGQKAEDINALLERSTEAYKIAWRLITVKLSVICD